MTVPLITGDQMEMALRRVFPWAIVAREPLDPCWVFKVPCPVGCGVHVSVVHEKSLAAFGGWIMERVLGELTDLSKCSITLGPAGAGEHVPTAHSLGGPYR